MELKPGETFEEYESRVRHIPRHERLRSIRAQLLAALDGEPEEIRRVALAAADAVEVEITMIERQIGGGTNADGTWVPPSAVH